MTETTFTERLVQARSQAGLSVAQAANLASIDKVRLAACERGNAQLNPPELRVLANIYGVSERWLMSGVPTVVTLPTNMPQPDADMLRGLLGGLHSASSPVRDAHSPFVAQLIGQLDAQRLIIAYMLGNLEEEEQVELALRLDFDLSDYISTGQAWWHYKPEEIMRDFRDGNIGEAFAAAYFAQDRLAFRERYAAWLEDNHDGR